MIYPNLLLIDYEFDESLEKLDIIYKIDGREFILVAEGADLYQLLQDAKLIRSYDWSTCSVWGGHSLVATGDTVRRQTFHVDFIKFMRNNLSKLFVRTLLETHLLHHKPKPRYKEGFWQRFRDFFINHPFI